MVGGWVGDWACVCVEGTWVRLHPAISLGGAGLVVWDLGGLAWLVGLWVGWLGG